jgi:hypothetical protein
MNFPLSPIEQHNRYIQALCEDWREAGTVTRITPRADRVLCIVRKIRKEGDE